jgi:hypothetical protein
MGTTGQERLASATGMELINFMLLGQYLQITFSGIKTARCQCALCKCCVIEVERKMRWTKLKSLVESRISPVLRKRVAIHSAAYGNCSCGHAWLTLDGEVIANFCTRAFWNRASGNFQRKNDRWVTDSPVPSFVRQAQKKKYGEMEYGELSRQDVFKSCWEFVHTLSIDEAFSSEDPLIQSLAVLDKRAGKARLRSLNKSRLHPLAGRLLSVRLDAEITASPPNKAFVTVLDECSL